MVDNDECNKDLSPELYVEYKNRQLQLNENQD